MSSEKENHLAQALGRLPRAPLASLKPTPLEPAPRLSAALGGPAIYIKRDDLNGLAFGGNKVRVLELAVGKALEEGAEVWVSGAAVQSNYCRQLAAACARYGIELHLLLRVVRPIDGKQVQGNHLLERIFGAKVTLVEATQEEQGQMIADLTRRLVEEGRRVHPGADDWALGPGYCEVVLELTRQCRDFDIRPSHLYLASTHTNQSGLVLGFRYLNSPIHVRGICPFHGWEARFDRMVRLATLGSEVLGLGLEFDADDFDNTRDFVGEGYGLPTAEAIEAIELVARTEGIILDPVYTGKAMAGLISDIREGRLEGDSPVIFLHTGGTPAVFAYADEFDHD